MADKANKQMDRVFCSESIMSGDNPSTLTLVKDDFQMISYQLLHVYTVLINGNLAG